MGAFDCHEDKNKHPPPGEGSKEAYARGGAHEAIARLAERQHGVLSRRQLLELGLGAAAIHYRVTSGLLRRIHGGVYAPGHAVLRPAGYRMAAVLACGPGAALSHRSAGEHLAIRSSLRSRIDVVTPRGGRRGDARIDVHRMRTLRLSDVTVHDAIPVTTVARTLLDLADVLRPDQLARAVEQTEILGLFDLRAVEAQLARANGRRGAPRLATVLAHARPERGRTRSGLELDFLALVLGAGIGEPEVNAPVELRPGEWVEVDFLWRAERVAVETDGGPFHRSWSARARDAARDHGLTRLGYHVLRFPDTEVQDDPGSVLATVRAALATAMRTFHPADQRG